MRHVPCRGFAPLWAILAVLCGFTSGSCSDDHASSAGSDSIDASVATLQQAVVSDSDGDGIANTVDNCPYFPNPNQANANGMGPGDACELSLSFSTGPLSQFARFQSHKELIILLGPVSLGSGPDLMRVVATAPSLAFANISPLTQKLGVRSLLELLPGDIDTVRANEVLAIELGTAPALGGAKASEVWLRLDGTATVSIKLLAGSNTVATLTASTQGTSWKRFNGNGVLFDRIEVRATSGKVAIHGGGDAVLFALGHANLPCPNGYERVGSACVDIDECAGINRVCDALTTCTNKEGSFLCGACPQGYRGDGLAGCHDVNECSEGTATCSALVPCSNTEGGYHCGDCPAGYRGDGHTCSDVDECAEHTDGCDPLVTCTNTPGGYTCGACPTGYIGGQTGCVDIDECTGPDRACDALVTCTNLQGSFRCGACPAGYRGDSHAGCVDIDECAEGSATCSPLVTCANTTGSFQCGACPSGYTGDGRSCTDVDECALGTAQCSELVTCHNTSGSYTCGTCPSGYAGDGQTCTDIDECLEHPCDPRVTCANAPGSYACGACPAGFTGDGHTGCVDIDECAVGTDSCSPLVTCGNTLGGYTCAPCPSGYSGDGHVCTDVDECVERTDTCSALASCTNTQGGYVCGGCPAGYTGDGHSCTDIDECKGFPCHELTTCSNTPGSYLCSACPSGYTGDGYAGCVDIDECAMQNGGCPESEGCVNTPGSHACAPCASGSVGMPTQCGVGACAHSGETICVRGVVTDTCVPGSAAPSDALCDGLDEDCDGAIDEEYPTTATRCGLGLCARTGVESCVNGVPVSTCVPGSAASSDVLCDGLDEDCDGAIDEDFVPEETACGVGACARTATVECVAGQLQGAACVPGEPASTDATCDGVDDDCNGQVDQQFPLTSSTCGTGACTAGGVIACVAGRIVDSCVPGAPAASTDTLCDGVDEDCDGAVDEDFVESETSCGTGTCAGSGIRSCVNGAVLDSCTVQAGQVCDDGNACNGADACSALGECLPVSNNSVCCDGAVLPDPLKLVPLDPTLVTTFANMVQPLHHGPLASQWPVAAGVIQRDKVGVVNGRVLDAEGHPLPCATISVLKAPEYGTTRSGADGAFAIALNGGSQAVIRAELPGYIIAYRTVQTRSNRYVQTDDIRLLPAPPAQPVSSSATTVTVVAGDHETDVDGSRRATLFFPPGSRATVQGEPAPRTEFGVRVKEMTNRSSAGRDAMPANLPR